MTKIYLLSVISFLSLGTILAQNNALYFDGANNRIGVTDSPSLNPSIEFTLEAWINSEEWANDIWAGSILCKEAGSPDEGYSLRCGANGRVGFNMSIDGVWQEANSDEILGLNTWYHIAGVYDGSTMKLYLNGGLITTTDVSGTFSPSTGGLMNIGENPFWTGRYFQGILDEVRIWDVARTENQILESMAVELVGDEPGLAAYYNFNEGAGNMAADATANANDGQLLNMVEEDWVNGFVPIDQDLSVTGIISPSVIGSGFSDAETVRVEVKNVSSNAVASFEVSYQIEGETEVSETVNQELLPFESYLHTFSATENLTGVAVLDITARVTFIDDGNDLNDELNTTIEQSLTQVLFDEVRHNFGSFGQTHFKPLAMPENLDAYSQVLLRVDLSCPNGGCDPWDQAAKVTLVKQGERYELARYITPYGQGCGGWSWDLSDFRSLMTGSVTWESYVQVWGASGWLVDMSLEFVEGAPAWEEVTVHKLWQTDGVVYGDPNISYDLEPYTVALSGNVEQVKVRMTTTGHGQGNTGNAAEFMNQAHHIHVNGTEAYAQDLWRSDCAQNECANQAGTWTGSRFGWCPGQDVQPWEQNLSTEEYTPGADLTIDYVLEDYTNALNTGYNNNGHTEPFYRIHGYLIEYAGNNVGVNELADETALDIYPNPSTGLFTLTIPQELAVQTIAITDVNGRTVKTVAVSGALQYTMNLSNLEAGIYLVNVATVDGAVVSKVVKE
jgi:hypothetical protein